MASTTAHFSRYQVFVIFALVVLQFTVILDFMIMSPLGAILMPELGISAQQFGKVVSAYAFSAGLAGFLAAGFADRFDRKTLLLFFYSGFILGTLFCGLSINYEMLLVARIVTGMFGGVINSIILSITTDLFSIYHRGRVLGYIQTAFAASQVLGIPIGLFFATHWGWHFPFFIIVGLGVLSGLILLLKLDPIKDHLSMRSSKNPILHLWHTLTNPRFTLSFFAMSLLSTGGFMLMPFSSAFAVGNLKIDLEHLPMIYLATGAAAMVMGPVVGKATDRFSKYLIFVIGSIFSSVMVLIYTHLGETPLWEVVLVNVILFAGIFSRIIPAQAIMTTVPDPVHRGSYMSVVSSLRQVAGGIASYVAGLIVIQMPDQSIKHFNIVGYVVVVTVAATIGLMYYVNRLVASET